MAAGIVERKLARGGVSYWIVFTWQKRQVWEHAGRVRREAQTLLAQRRREVKEGTYVPHRARTATTFGQFARQWLDSRRVRTVEDEDRWIRDYVVSREREWLDRLPLVDLAPKHMAQLVRELKENTVGRKTGRPLSSKSVANIYGIVCTIVRDARIAELVPRDPCVLPKGLLARKSTRRRVPYEAGEVLRLVSDEGLPADVRMWNALAFFGGMREGEVCGRRWRDYDPNAQPLGSLSVSTQYDDQPLKTDEEGETRPRMVPVHPVLAWMLDRWRAGFEIIHCHAPRPDDFIVPNRDGSNHTKSSAYKMFRKALAKLGIQNRTLHATRNTFISLARRGGGRKDVVERITHNAAGDVVDAYTHWDWAPLCEAVLCITIDSRIARVAETPCNVVEAPGIEPEIRHSHTSDSDLLEQSGSSEDPPEQRSLRGLGADHGANHGRRLEALGRSDRPAPPASLALAKCSVAALAESEAVLEDDLERLRRAGGEEP